MSSWQVANVDISYVQFWLNFAWWCRFGLQTLPNLINNTNRWRWRFEIKCCHLYTQWTTCCWRHLTRMPCCVMTWWRHHTSQWRHCRLLQLTFVVGWLPSSYWTVTRSALYMQVCHPPSVYSAVLILLGLMWNHLNSKFMCWCIHVSTNVVLKACPDICLRSWLDAVPLPELYHEPYVQPPYGSRWTRSLSLYLVSSNFYDFVGFEVQLLLHLTFSLVVRLQRGIFWI